MISFTHLEPEGHSEVYRFAPPLVWILDVRLYPTTLVDRKVWTPSNEEGVGGTSGVTPLSLPGRLGNIVLWQSPQQK